jgi:hypothetical protein
MNTPSYDWRKIAAQAAMPDDQVEKAFFDQAATFISNKAAPLMRDPYRLGFEIVQKNDDNTRMVGIFAFRVGRDLFYAPAFFLNGEIKGTDLFYRHTTKTFVPLTEDWVKFLMEQDEQTTGQGVDRSERQKAAPDLQLRRISQPPLSHFSGFKYASTGAEVLIDPAFEVDGKLDWQTMLKEAATQKPLEPIIRRFMIEDGGWEAFTKVAAAVEANPAFAARLVNSCGDDWCPDELAQVEKRANAEPELILYTGLCPDMSKEAAAEFFRTGYKIEDKRKDDDTSVVYEDATLELKSVGQVGMYKILTREGDMAKAFCARECLEELCGDPHGNKAILGYDRSAESDGEATEGDQFPETRFVTEDGEWGHSLLVLGEEVEDTKSPFNLETDNDMLLKKMESGHIYMMFNSINGTLTEPFYVTKSEKKNDITLYHIAVKNNTKTRILKHNPDYNGVSAMHGIAGDKARFVKVNGEGKEIETDSAKERGGDVWAFNPKEVLPGDDDSVRTFLLDHGAIKEARVLFRGGEYQFRGGYKAASQRMDRMSMAVNLARHLHIKSAAVEDILNRAELLETCRFLIEPPANKMAGTIHLMNQPDFQTASDPDFGVEIDFPQKFQIPTHTETDHPPEHRVGDAWDPGMGHGEVKNPPIDHTTKIRARQLTESSEPVGEVKQASQQEQDGLPMDTLLNSSPQQLAQMSQQDSIPHLFEHGVVGSLVNTFDSAAMLDKYLPDMEKGLDRAGRTLFLFYWKPGDFQNLYGVDDMTNLENKLLSNFKSWGDLVLDLMKKTRSKQMGSAPLASSA